MTHSVFLSILIPVYNWNVSSLLRCLLSQVESLQGSCIIEIIVMDDGSTKRYEIPSTLLENPSLYHHAFAENRGRAAIRQMLLSEAGGEFVLFLDGDMLPDDECFLKKYIEHARAGKEIICGGISYRQYGGDTEDYPFYLFKSMKTEAISAEKRRQYPWRYLFTSNVMVRKEVAEKVPFDTRFAGYGFEDIEWGLRLASQYTIHHIENTCTHLGLHTKRQTFLNMRESIGNYALLLSLHPGVTAGSTGVKFSRILSFLPVFLLDCGDRLLSALFTLSSANSLAFFFFQCDKMVLLAKALKQWQQR